jgi:hypothetical protein
VTLVAGLVLMAALSWRAAARLPDPVIFAGAGRDGADAQAPRLLVLTVMPLLTLVIGTVGLAAQRMRRAVASALRVPLWRDDRTHRRAADLALGILTPVLAALHLTMLRAAEGDLESGLSWIAGAVALVVIAIGNVWPKQVPVVPELIRSGLRPRTLQRLDQASEDQRRRLRPTGLVMMLIGLIALGFAGPAPQVSLGISVLAVLVMGAVPLATALRA